MSKINDNFLKIPETYLFAEIGRRVAQYKNEHPSSDLIRMGIGDVTMPLAPSVVTAMHKAVDEMGVRETFRGYPDYEGYDFLRSSISKYDYFTRGVTIGLDEIFVSDGAKSDCSGIGDIFDTSNIVAVCDPVYPVYVDSNAMAGRCGDFINEKWTKIYYMPCVEENNFVPELPKQHVDLIYLCYPNNPTGTTLTKAELQLWVDWANENQAVILFDSAYEAFITQDDVPHSIYECDGAKTCAIEFRSFSKTAGFTGTRCAYTVIPKELVVDGVSLNKLWLRRQSTKFNGVSYITQRGANAVYTDQGQSEIRRTISGYLENAKTIKDGLAALGFSVYGGVNAPYIWLKTPNNLSSWQFFDELLSKANVVGTPGSGFGPSGEGYFRLTAFGSPENAKEALARIAKIN